MATKKIGLLIGSVPIRKETETTDGEYVQLFGERYYRISCYDQMPPFFMSLVSSSDHWIFLASSGGLTAGRINADFALFPYETEDKIIAHGEETGGKTLLRVEHDGRTYLWEPFSERYAGVYRSDRNLYKNGLGNKLVYEEVNHDLRLTLRIAWQTGERFGFIRTCWLHNDADSSCQIDLLDGFQNLLPYGATADLQSSYSSLLNAYKRNELEQSSGLGIFSLSATLTDRAEPSESLQASVAWQIGLDADCYLLCKDQVDGFRYGHALVGESDVCGKPAAYLVNAAFQLPPQTAHQWHVVADVNQDSSDVTQLIHLLRSDKDEAEQLLKEDVARGSANLVNYAAAADGLQMSAAELTTTHHYANVLFNIMRGGIFVEGYRVRRDNLRDFMQLRNRAALQAHAGWLDDLPKQLTIRELYERAAMSRSPDLIRLCYEYLPLTFSRRHGDPSRPWNRFSINTKKPDGSPKIDYQGNWRDIFQNWEPLALSFPDYAVGMVVKFLNATTADGYNPYRVTHAGIEWEVPNPDNPWANIGYWSDHQIIYLQKLLEIVDRVDPMVLPELWSQTVFSYANVPYRLRPYSEMLDDWYNTIDFDWEREEKTRERVINSGTDGRLVRDQNGDVLHVTMVEKLLVLLLAKLVNLVPEGGIWMNTQRPEWNDANNALVGKGLSVATVAYLRRFIAFWSEKLGNVKPGAFMVNAAVAELFNQVQTIFVMYQDHLESGFNDRARRAIMDELGMAVTTYRAAKYDEGLPEEEVELTSHEITDFLTVAQSYIEHTLRANQRQDGLTHSYNVLQLSEQEAAVQNLYPMLEGQVALLSSGMLTTEEALKLLQSIRLSDLYRPDLHTYMLYPNRKLPGFIHKNNVSAEQVAGSELVSALAGANDNRLLIRDEMGVYHFNGGFRNASDVANVLDELAAEAAYTKLVATERDFMLGLFETTFNHRAFTGRSGTFFAYEGLGSVYWHMVSKLLLAVQECYQQAKTEQADPAIATALAEAYYDIRHGLGFNKSPVEYGAFPTDPYSHTPMGGGARQPGMTGQVKEEILTRWGELGVSVQNGTIHFSPTLIQMDEFLPQPSEFTCFDVAGEEKKISLPPNSLAFTFCQTPIIYTKGDQAKIEVKFTNQGSVTKTGKSLDIDTAGHIFARDHTVEMVHVTVETDNDLLPYSRVGGG